MYNLLLSKKQKEKLVIKLAEEGKTSRDIAKQVHISLKDIGRIIHKATEGDDSDLIEKEQEIEKQKRFKSLSPYAQAFQMFKDDAPLEDVAIELDLNTDAVLDFYEDFLRLLNMVGLVTIYNDLGNDIIQLFYLYSRIKKEGLGREDVEELLENKQELKFLEKRVVMYNEHIKGQQERIKQLDQVIGNLGSKTENYNYIDY
ncbi:MAG TPA: hypothetical protein VIY08_05465 [Candidatus Nitrosocosmicus sp.]